MACLTQSEVAHYREQGYLVPAFSLAQQQVDRLRVSLERLIRDNPDVRPEKLVSAHIAGRDGAPNAEGVRGHQDFLELARDSAILDAVEQLIARDDDPAVLHQVGEQVGQVLFADLVEHVRCHG